MSLLIKNIKSLLQLREEGVEKVAGKEMAHLPHLDNAWLITDGDRILDYGEMTAIERALKNAPPDLLEIDANAKYVLPAFCDSHTHLVYPASREIEYIDKIKGLSYEEIAKRGGGILNSAKRMNEASEDELLESALQRLEEIMNYGTGAVEIKSGYGLNTENELKMLRVIRKLKAIIPTQHCLYLSRCPRRSCRI